MIDPPSPRLLTLFEQALDVERPDDRAALLDEACAGEPDLRREVDALLAAHAAADGFLENPRFSWDVLAEPLKLDLPGRAIGPYTLGPQIGMGGMGVVFEARQAALHRDVALKIVRLDSDAPRVLERFLAEREVLTRMDHPGIARVYDAGVDALDRPYFVMELIRGKHITRYCDDERLTVDARVRLVIDVCRALEHAHQRGVIHRDVKPPNILVARDAEGDPVVKIIDFGVAKAVNARIGDLTQDTLTYGVVGTLAYMSPEQLGDPDADEPPLVDVRSDVYAVGVVLYELLAGSRPIEPTGLLASDLNYPRRIRDEEPVPPSVRVANADDPNKIAYDRSAVPRQLERALRNELDWIVMKALEKSPDDRYAGIGELAADLGRYLDGDILVAGRPSRLHKARKIFRRRRGLILSVSGVIASLAVLAGVAAVEARRAYVAGTAAARSEKEARSLLGFVNNRVVAAAKPADASGGLGKDVTLRAALDNAEIAVNADFGGQPLLEAQIREMLAEAYHDLGAIEAERKQAGLAHRIRKERLGPADPDTLRAMTLLGRSMVCAGDDAKAVDLQRDQVQLAREALGDDDVVTLEGRLQLGAAFVAAGKFAEALRTYEDAHERLERKFNADHGLTLKALEGLATSLHKTGRFAEAVELLQRKVKKDGETHGAYHARTQVSRNNLAVAMLEAGQPDAAVKLLKTVLDRRAPDLDADHPHILTARNNLGHAYAVSGRPDEALPLLREAAERFRAKLGPAHRLTLMALVNEGDVLLDLGRPDEALPVFQAALDAALAESPDAPSGLNAGDRVGLTLLRLNRGSEAEPILRRVFDARDRLGGPDWCLGHTMNLLGAALAAQGRHEEAQRLLVRGCEMIEAARGQIPYPHRRDIAAAAARVAAFYLDRGDRAAADQWNARAIVPSDSPNPPPG